MHVSSLRASLRTDLLTFETVEPGRGNDFLCSLSIGYLASSEVGYLKSIGDDMNRTEKEELVAEMRDVFESSSTVVVAHYSGLTVSEMEALRAQMRETGAGFKVTKNRLTKLALADSKFEGLGEMLSGPTAIAYSEDAVAAAKAAVEFSKTNEKLVILGGAMDETALDVAGVKALASMPSLDELRGKIVGVLQAPAQKLAAVSQAPAGQLARVFGAYGKSEA